METQATPTPKPVTPDFIPTSVFQPFIFSFLAAIKQNPAQEKVPLEEKNSLSSIVKEYDTSGFIAGVSTGMQLTYFGARYYDADVGAWTSTDAAGQFFNAYQYTTNPVSYVDPDGNFIPLLIFGIWAAMGTNMVQQGLKEQYSLNHGGYDYQFSVSQWLWTGAIGGISSVAGVAIGAGFADVIGGGFWGATIGGAVGGASGGAISGFGNAAVQGLSGGQIWESTWKGVAWGAAFGGAFGAINYEIQRARYLAQLKNRG